MEARNSNATTLPKGINWLNNSQIENLLGISGQYLRKDKSALKSLGLLKAPKKTKGLEREGIELLIEFRELVEERGREPAIQEIWRRKKNGSQQR